MNRRFGFAKLSALLVLATLYVGATGCGGGDGNRVSGSVTFDGKPVPAGKVYFNPDGAKGNAGTTGFADIVNGSYDTAASGGRGAPTGAVKITVEGHDPTGADPSNPDISAKRLFSGYEITADIAEGATTQDIAVPLEAGKAAAPYVERPLNIGP